MSTPAASDTATLNLMLSELRLPTIKALWPQFTAQADREGWPAARLLTALTEHEIADRARRRFQRRLGEARLPSGKTLDSFDFSVVPTLSKAHVMALCGGDRWLDEGSNLLLIGPPGTGKTHLSAAIGLALVGSHILLLFFRAVIWRPHYSELSATDGCRRGWRMVWVPAVWSPEDPARWA